MARIIRSDYKGFAYPKYEKGTHKKSKRAATPESILQEQVNNYLEIKGLKYLRLPDALFRALFPNPNIQPWVKHQIKLAIAGWPDNIVMVPLYNMYCLTLLLECKTDIGQLTGLQKERSKELPFKVVRTFDEAKKEIDTFVKCAEIMTGKINN